MKAKLIIDMPKNCEECPLQAMFFDSEYSLKKGIKHISCRLRLDKATLVGGGRPDYCKLQEVEDESNIHN